MRRPAALLIAAALLLAGCGGSTPARTPVTAGDIQHATGHACNPADQVMQCVLATVPAPARKLALSPAIPGVDFAWTKIPPSQAGGFGASYLSSDPSKNWNPGLIAQYHQAGKGTVAVFENGGSEALSGCAAGAADARFGEQLLASWGYPHSHEDLAIDFDASGPDVLSYFQCANQAEPGLIGAYGGYRPLQFLCSKGVITLSWQTYAWSGGLFLPASCAPLEQWLNGSAFDHDRAIAANYGQFPTPAPPKPPGPSSAQLKRWHGARDASLRAYRRDRCTLPVLGSATCGRLAWRVVHFQALLDQGVRRPVCFGRHAQPHAAACQIVRPEVAVYSRARDSSERQYLRHNCEGIAGFGRPSSAPICKLLGRRRDYFNGRARQTFRAWT